jgi:hypothetical protein
VLAGQVGASDLSEAHEAYPVETQGESTDRVAVSTRS